MLNCRFVVPLLMAEWMDIGGCWVSVCWLMGTPQTTKAIEAVCRYRNRAVEVERRQLAPAMDNCS